MNSKWMTPALLAMVAALMAGGVSAFDGDPNINHSWRAYPEAAKTPEEAQLLVERRVPKAIKPNEEYTYTLRVTNLAGHRVDEVVVTELLPEGYKLTSASPQNEQRDNLLRWNLGMLAPGQRELLTVVGKMTKPGTTTHNGSVEANFNLGLVTVVMEVVQGLLSASLTVPEVVLVTENFDARIRIRNPGSAKVTNVVLKHAFKEGLQTANQNRQIMLRIDALEPEEEKVFDLSLMASKTGIFEEKLEAVADDGIKTATNMKLTVQKPVLTLAADFPERRFVGNPIRYRFDLKNTGDGMARDLVVKMDLPEGLELREANEGGRVEDGKILWRLKMDAGESKALNVVIIGQKVMLASIDAQAEAFAADPVTVSCKTDIQGIPAILTELADVNDPVAVGENETYIVKVTNTGSLAATGVVLRIELEDAMEFVSLSGPSKVKSVDGNKIVLESVPSLAPQDVAEWRVITKAKAVGDIRFHTYVNCDQLSGAVYKNEATNVYK